MQLQKRLGIKRHRAGGQPRTATSADTTPAAAAATCKGGRQAQGTGQPRGSPRECGAELRRQTRRRVPSIVSGSSWATCRIGRPTLYRLPTVLYRSTAGLYRRRAVHRHRAASCHILRLAASVSLPDRRLGELPGQWRGLAAGVVAAEQRGHQVEEQAAHEVVMARAPACIGAEGTQLRLRNRWRTTRLS